MPLPTYRAMFSSSTPPLGEVVTAFGSPFVVANTNGAAAAADPDDPYDVLDGTGANHGNVRPVTVPLQYRWAELFHVWCDAAAQVVTTEPVVRIYGKAPLSQNGKREWPQDLDPALTNDFPDISSWGLWVPLADRDQNLDITLDGIGADHRYVVAGPTNRQAVWSQSRHVFLAGVTEVIVLVKTAFAPGAAQAGSDRSVIGLRFTA